VFQPIPIEAFRERVSIHREVLRELWGRDAEFIVSPRNITRILNVQAMPMTYLKTLISQITLVNSDIRPYKDCPIEIVGIDPSILRVGQKFVEWSKVRSLLIDFPEIFKEYCLSRGIVNSLPIMILGVTESDKGEVPAMAHYLPPIVEDNNGKQLLLDGIHRNFLVNRVGAVLQAVRIRKVKIPFPGKPQHWDSIKLVTEKPPPEERYFDLQPELFRDLKRIGIDG